MSIKRTNWFYLLFTILSLPAQLGLISFLNDLLHYNQTVTIANYLFWFAVGCIFLKLENASFFETLPYNKGLKPVIALMIIAITFLCQPMIICLSTLGSVIFGDFLGAADVANTMIGENVFLNLFNIAVIPAVFEELFFRGFFYSPYKKAGGARKAILLSALLFGIFHMNFQQAIYATAMGIVLGILRQLTGSMWAGMLFHFVNNGYSAFLITVQKYWWSEVADFVPSYQLGFDTRGKSVLTVVVAFLCMCLVDVLMKKIAQIEGKEEEFKGFFAQDKGEGTRLVTAPLIIGILVCFSVMCLVFYFMPELEEILKSRSAG